MCLIVFAWRVVPGAELIAAANRDEFYDRPAQAAHWWADSPDVYAGRDLKSGGTWMGVTRDGRFACITNIRAPSETKADATSRGLLVADFLKSSFSPAEYIEKINGAVSQYNGFNLLLGDSENLIWFSNKPGSDERNGKPLAPGLYGISNAGLDHCWPKVVRTKAQFASLLCQGAPDDAFFEMLSDTTIAPDCRLPKTGVSLELERMLSAVCIESPTYGTRVSTLVKLMRGELPLLQERPVSQ